MAITEKLAMAPPDSRSSKPSNWFDSNSCFKAAVLTPGTGT